MARKKAVKTEDTKIETTQGVTGQVPQVISEDTTKPTVEVVQEESTETEADVPEMDNIAVIDVQEATEGVSEGVTSKEADEALIDLTPVGAEVVEDAVNNVQDEEDATYIETDEDGDGVPEYYVMDWANKPVAATLVQLRETRINNLVEKVLFASYLGGDLHNNGTQLGRVPFRASVLIPNDKVEQFLSGEGKLEYEEDFNYVDVTVKGVNATLFLKRLMMVGKKGAVIAPKKKAMNNMGYLVSLKCKAPVEASASSQLSAKKPVYSVDELKSLSAESLKIICGWYKLPYRGKNQSRIDVSEYYKGKK